VSDAPTPRERAFAALDIIDSEMPGKGGQVTPITTFRIDRAYRVLAHALDQIYGPLPVTPIIVADKWSSE
jgi:hypothetical protein